MLKKNAYDRNTPLNAVSARTPLSSAKVLTEARCPPERAAKTHRNGWFIRENPIKPMGISWE